MNFRPNKGHMPPISPFLCVSVVLYHRNALIHLAAEHQIRVTIPAIPQ